MMSPRGRAEARPWYLQERILAAGDDEAELEHPEVLEAAVVEEREAQEGDQEGHEDGEQVLQDGWISTENTDDGVEGLTGGARSGVGVTCPGGR